MPHLAFLDIGFPEAFIICLISLLLFGGKLPDMLRQVGRTVGELKRQAQRLTRDLQSEIDRPQLKIEPPKVAIAREPKHPAGGSAANAPAPNPAASSAPGDASTTPPASDTTQ